VSRLAQSSPDELFEAACHGDRAALARVLSLVERGGPDARAIGIAMARLAPHRQPTETGTGTYTVGITGAPGSGKSTLTAALLRVVRARDERVAVLAVDPSSPYSGGAILGDRLRMGDHALDKGVFVRSMASRGHLGGLAVATPEAVRVLGTAGYPWVLVETVGVGQVEVEVAGHTDTTVVVVNPGWGDAVQAAKAGLMEIADVFVINKADRPGADEARRDLERMLDMASLPEGAWRPPVILATSTSGAGVEDMWEAILDHRRHLEASGELAEQRRQRARDEIARMVAAKLAERSREITAGPRAAELADALARGETDPWTAADELLDL
jgi:LAO/AO transport system kinase